MIKVYYKKFPLKSDELHEFEHKNQTILDIASNFDPHPDYTKVYINGFFIPYDQWSNVTPNDDVDIRILDVPKELTTILLVTTIVLSVASTALSFILTPDAPTPPGERERLKRISGQKNEPKRFETIPAILGKRRITPAYAANSWVETIGDDEFGNYLFALGHSPLSIDNSSFKIGDTNINQFENVEFAVFSDFGFSNIDSLRNIWKSDVSQTLIDIELDEDFSFNFERFNNSIDPRSNIGDSVTRTTTESQTGQETIVLDFNWPAGAIKIDPEDGEENWSSAVEVSFRINGVKYVVAKYREVDSSFSGESSNIPKGTILRETDTGVFHIGDMDNNQSPSVPANGGLSIRQPEVVIPDSNIIEYDSQKKFIIIRIDNSLQQFKDVPGNNITFYQGEDIRIASVSVWRNNDETNRGLEFNNPFFETQPTLDIDVAQIYGSEDVEDGSTKFQGKIIWRRLTTKKPLSLDNFKKLIGIDQDDGKFPFIPAIIALRIKATNQFSGQLKEFSLEAQSVVPTDWDADWRDHTNISILNKKVSDNPADMFRWLLQGSFNKRPASNDKIDLDKLKEWRDFCDANGFKVSKELNEQSTLQEELNNIAFTGRASYSNRDGKHSVAIEKDEKIPQQIFTAKNSSNFKLEREFKETVDGVKYEFENEEKDYEKDEGKFLDPRIDPVDQTGTFDRIQLWGISNPDLATRHARYQYWKTILQREAITLTTDIESLVCSRGGLVKVQSDVIDVGLGSGRITDVSFFVNEIEFNIDETINIVTGQTYFISLRKFTGEIQEFSADYLGDGLWKTQENIVPEIGEMVIYGNQGSLSIDCTVKDINFKEDYSADLTLVKYDPQLFNLDEETIPEFNSNANPRTDNNVPSPPTINIPSNFFNFSALAISITVNPGSANDDLEGFKLEYVTTNEDELNFNEQTSKDIPDEFWKDVGFSRDGKFNFSVSRLQGTTYAFRARALAENGLYSAFSDRVTATISTAPADPPLSISLVERTNTPKSAAGNLVTIVATVEPPDDDNYRFAIIEHRLLGEPNWQISGNIGSSFESEAQQILVADGKTYEFRARSQSVWGVESRDGPVIQIQVANVDDPDFDDENPRNFLPVPNVTGLELFEQGNDTEFTGRDAKFTWRKTQAEDWVEVGSEKRNGVGLSNVLDEFFKDYQVEVWVDGSIVRVENILDNIWTYTFEKNSDDFIRENNEFGAYREFEVRVFNRSRAGQISQTPAKLTVNNPPPEVPDNIQFSAAFSLINLNYDRPDDRDFAGIQLWMDTEPDFGRNETNLIYEGNNDSVDIPNLETNTTYYFVVSPFDDFGKVDTPSIEFNKTTLQILDGDRDKTPPDKVQNLTATTGVEDEKLYSISFIKLVWDVVDNVGIANYTIESDRDDEFTVVNPNFRLVPATPGETYQFRVRANSFAEVEGPFSDWVSITAAESQDSPQDVINASATSGLEKVILEWTNPDSDNFHTVNIHRSTTSGFTPNDSNRISSIPGRNGSNQKFVDDGVDTETTYFYRLIPSTTSKNEGNPSIELSASPFKIESVNIDKFIDNAAIVTDKISNNAIKNSKLSDLAVTANKLADSSVEATKINNLAVGNAAIANGAITNAKIGNAAVNSAQIANAAIKTANIADANIVSAKIGNAEIKTANMNNLAVTDAKINDLDGSKILANTITTNKLAADSITSNEISVTQLDAISANLGEMTSGTITGALIRTADPNELAVDNKSRIELDDQSLTGFDNQGNITYQFRNDGSSDINSSSFIGGSGEIRIADDGTVTFPGDITVDGKLTLDGSNGVGKVVYQQGTARVAFGPEQRTDNEITTTYLLNYTLNNNVQFGVTETGGAEFTGAVTITGGSGVANLDDTGSLAGKDNADSNDVTFDYALGTTKGGNAVDTDNVDGETASNVKDGANRANNGLDFQGNVAKPIRGSQIPNLTPNQSGLYLTNQFLGFHNGNGSFFGWQTYIRSNGQFHFGNNSSNFIDFDGSRLQIRTDDIAIDTNDFKLFADGSAEFSGDLSAASISGDNITGGTITGSTLQTSSSGERFVVDDSDNKAKFFNSSNEEVVTVGLTNDFEFKPTNIVVNAEGENDYGISIKVDKTALTTWSVDEDSFAGLFVSNHNTNSKFARLMQFVTLVNGAIRDITELSSTEAGSLSLSVGKPEINDQAIICTGLANSISSPVGTIVFGRNNTGSRLEYGDTASGNNINTSDATNKAGGTTQSFPSFTAWKSLGTIDDDTAGLFVRVD